MSKQDKRTNKEILLSVESLCKRIDQNLKYLCLVKKKEIEEINECNDRISEAIKSNIGLFC